LVFRVYGDSSPIVARLEDTEAIPGPLPYKDAEGNPLFTFCHAGYDAFGGRLLAAGPIDVIIQKQDQLNQLDSHVLLCYSRMANPVIVEPKGAEIEKLTGMPGLVIKWNPLTVGGNAKPERWPGVEVPQSAFKLREQFLKDIEQLTGTFDIMKGAKPAGIEAFSALNLMKELSQGRFATVFKARGLAYSEWFKFAIELEREFGPDERTKAVQSPARTWTFQNFKRTQLQGSISVIVEDGSMAPKTTLGMRAAVEHASQLGMINLKDPDQQYEALKLFGLTRIAPTLDIHIQRALQKQDAFEQWALNKQAMQQSMMQSEQAIAKYEQTLAMHTDDGTGMVPPPPSPLEFTPLKWRPWYRAIVHKQQFELWANADRVSEMLQQNPGLEQLLVQHYQEIEQAVMQQAQTAAIESGNAPMQTPGGQAMGNSNRESTQGNEPGQTKRTGQPA